MCNIFNKRLGILLLCAVMLLSAASCGANDAAADTNVKTDTSAAETTAQTVETEDLSYQCDAPVVDFGGETFDFLLFGDGVPENWSEIDIVRDEQTGEVINDSIITRNREIEEKYNVKIAGKYDLSAPATMQKLVASGDDTYEAVFLQMAAAGSAAKSGYCVDFNTIPNIDINKGYWDHSIVDDMSVGGKVYMLTGDISTIDNQATWILMFNKSMIGDFNLDSPYTAALDGTWAIEKFASMEKDITADIDGNGVMDKNDRWGLSTTPDTVYGLFYSCGAQLVTKDDNDYPQFALDVNRISSIFEKSAAIMSADNALVTSRIKGSSDLITDIRTVFIEKRALFYCEVMFHVANLRQMETDFGILPMPKYDEAQENYITFVNPASTVLLVPKTNEKLENTGALLEAFAYSSYKNVTPAYYDTALVGKYTRDEESKEMLDILLVNRTYDLGLIYGWSSFMSKYNALVISGNNNLSSLIAESESKMSSELEKFIGAVNDNT